MKEQAVDVCGNDGGGGDNCDCEADGREATGSTGRGGHVTQEPNSVSDYVSILENREELQMCDGGPFRTERQLQI